MKTYREKVLGAITSFSDLYSKYVKFDEKDRNKANRMVFCPFHDNKNTPAMSINVTGSGGSGKGLYFCYSCKAKGDVIEFYKNMFNLDFKEALARLGKDVGVEPSDSDNHGGNGHDKEPRYGDDDFADFISPSGDWSFGGDSGPGVERGPRVQREKEEGSSGTDVATATETDITTGTETENGADQLQPDESGHPGNNGNPDPGGHSEVRQQGEAGEQKEVEPKPETKPETTTEVKPEPKPGKYPPLTEEALDILHKSLVPEVYSYFENRKISKEVIDNLKLGLWKNSYVVYPVRKNSKLHTYRFYKPARNGEDKRIWQLEHKKEDKEKGSIIWLFPEPDQTQETIHLFEGETDCMCALSLGLNATTVTGGASTFNNETLPIFKDKIVYVCYDIDDAGEKGSKSVATIISQVAKETRVVKLPLDKTKYPNGDFNDYIAKEGHTRKDFEKLLKNSELMVHVDDGMEMRVMEKEGSYYSIDYNKKGEITNKKITNFTIRLLRRYFDSDKKTIQNEVEFVSSGKNVKSSPRVVPSEAYTACTKFKEFCAESNFFYEGGGEHVTSIWRLVDAQDKKVKIICKEIKTGYIESEGIWMFKNAVIKDGVLLENDGFGVYWNGSKGYYHTGSSKTSSLRLQPRLRIPEKDDKPSEEIIKELSLAIHDNTGLIESLHGLGLACGSIYYRELIQNDLIGVFPILFVHGKARCGKNEYVGFLMRMFGMGRNDCVSIPSITSTAGISRKLSYYPCIPIWMDEYRNNVGRTTGQLDGIFRSAYMGSGRTRGIRSEHGIIEDVVDSPVIISGEELPADEATYSRMVVVSLSENYRNNDRYKDVLNLSEKAGSHIYNLIVNKSKETAEKLINKIHNLIEIFTDKLKTRADGRVIKNLAISVGCYETLVYENDPRLREYVISEQMDNRRDSDEESRINGVSMHLADFITGVDLAITKGEVEGFEFYREDLTNNSVSIWITPLYQAWAKSYRMTTGQNPPDERTIRDHLKTTNFLLAVDKQVKLFSGMSEKKNRKCMVFDLSKMPDAMKNWFKEKD